MIRVPLLDARRTAKEFVALIADSCERLEIAGSIRRGAPTVKDFEVVAIGRGAALHHKLDGLLNRGVIEKQVKSDGKTRWGMKYRALVYNGMTVEIFITTPENWGVTLVIRTGPGVGEEGAPKRWAKGGANAILVTPNARGGLCPPQYKFKDGGLYLRGRHVPVGEERELFDRFMIPFTPPDQRSVATYLNLIRVQASNLRNVDEGDDISLLSNRGLTVGEFLHELRGELETPYWFRFWRNRYEASWRYCLTRAVQLEVCESQVRQATPVEWPFDFELPNEHELDAEDVYLAKWRKLQIEQERNRRYMTELRRLNALLCQYEPECKDES